MRNDVSKVVSNLYIKQKDFFASRNLRSSPTFKTLMKRKTPNRIAQKETIPIIIFVLNSRFKPDDDVVRNEAVKRRVR